MGETTAAVTALGEARGILNRSPMAAGDLGARMNMVTALTSYQAGQVPAGDAALNAALAYQKTGSLWLFQIGLVDSLYLSGEIYDRVAALLYELVLRDPAPIDWATSPLESLSVLSHPHPLSYEHWFEATLKRGKEPELALEIADRTRAPSLLEQPAVWGPVARAALGAGRAAGTAQRAIACRAARLARQVRPLSGAGRRGARRFRPTWRPSRSWKKRPKPGTSRPISWPNSAGGRRLRK